MVEDCNFLCLPLKHFLGFLHYVIVVAGPYFDILVENSLEVGDGVLAMQVDDVPNLLLRLRNFTTTILII